MKISLLLCTLFSTVLFNQVFGMGTGAAPDWLKAPDSRWHLTLESALQQARAEKKKVYVLQTGSDWCGVCVYLYKRVLSSQEFKRFAKNNLILVYLDFPRRKNMPQSQKEYNRKIARRLNFPRAYPSAAVLNENGEVLSRKRGGGGQAAYMRFLQNAVRSASPAVSGSGTSSGWLPGPSPEWHTKWETARDEARKSNKKIYVLKTGSDWCGWCVKLYRDVFSTQEFKDFARNNLVLLYLDFPRRKNMSQSQKAYNSRIVQQLQLSGGFPTAVLLDEQGKLIRKRGGYGNLSKYLEFLRNAVGQTAAVRNDAPQTIPYKTSPRTTGKPAPEVPSPPVSAQAAVPSGWLPGPSPRWHVKLETAVEEARKSNKKIFAIKTGSDWCSWCVKLYNDVLSQRQFLSFADQNLVLLYLDFPNRKSMPAAQNNYNSQTVSKISASGGYPTAVLLDQNGKFIRKFSGYAPAGRYIKRLRSAL